MCSVPMASAPEAAPSENPTYTNPRLKERVRRIGTRPKNAEVCGRRHESRWDGTMTGSPILRSYRDGRERAKAPSGTGHNFARL